MTKLLGPLFVWLGGGLFVTSLALTGWTYAFWFGRSLEWQGWTPLAVDAALVAIFALHHSVFARPRAKAAIARWWPDQLLRSLYVWVASLLLMLVCLLWRSIGSDVYRATASGMIAVHAAVQLSGVWLIARSVSAIDALELAGIHPPRRSDSLQVSGPYRLVRHPLYLGWMLIMFGAAHLTGDRLAFATLTSVYLIVAIPWEERSLENAFGAAYAQYRDRVRWRIVPWVY